MDNDRLKNNQPNLTERSPKLLSKAHKFPDFPAKNIPLVSNISEQALANLITKSKAVRYTKKTNISTVFNKTNLLVIIFSGNVSVTNRSQPATDSTLIRVQEPSAGFGKIALLTAELRAVSAITVEKTVFAFILKNDFVNWLMNYPEVEFGLWRAQKENLPVD
jgi:signal-transduction protein with cAMP-binding, CBS, and nucleotidyltransferase domain